jgi:hypothetical protein
VLPGVFDGGIAIQWVRGATPIPGRVAETYTLVAADAGRLVTARVTYSRPGYTSVVEQVTTGAVLRGVMARRPDPRIAGRARVGELLTAVPGAHDAGATVRYQWLANGQTVRGATGRIFRVPARYRGDRIRVRTITSKPGYFTVTRVSEATGKVV